MRQGNHIFNRPIVDYKMETKSGVSNYDHKASIVVKKDSPIKDTVSSALITPCTIQYVYVSLKLGRPYLAKKGRNELSYICLSFE